MNQPYLKRLIDHLIDSSSCKVNSMHIDSIQNQESNMQNNTYKKKIRTPLEVLNIHPQNNQSQLISNCLHLINDNTVQHQNYIQEKNQQPLDFSMHKKNPDKVLFEFQIIIDIGDGRGDSIIINQDSQPYQQARLFCKKHGLDEYIANILGNSFSQQKHYEMTLAEKEQTSQQIQSNQIQRREKNQEPLTNKTHSNFTNEDIDSDFRRLQESIERNTTQNNNTDKKIISKTLEIKSTHEIYINNQQKTTQQKNIGAEKLLSKKKQKKQISEQRISTVVNRLYKPKINKNLTASGNSQECTYQSQPTMNEISREIINKVGKDQIITNKMNKTKQKINRLKMESQNSINENLKECHFKPKINRISVKVDEEKNSRAFQKQSDHPNSGIILLQNSLKENLLFQTREAHHEEQQSYKNMEYDYLDFKIPSGPNTKEKQQWDMTQNNQKTTGLLENSVKYCKTQSKNQRTNNLQGNINFIYSDQNPNLFFAVDQKKDIGRVQKNKSYSKEKKYSNSKQKIKQKNDSMQIPPISTSKKVNKNSRYEMLYQNAKDIANRKERIRKNSIESITFKPKINDISRRIMEKSTQKGTSAVKKKRNSVYSQSELRNNKNTQNYSNILYSGLFPQQSKQKICELEKSYIESEYIKKNTKDMFNKSWDNFYHSKKNSLYNENRNSKQLPIGDYLYEQALLVQKKKDKIRQKQFQIQRGPQILSHSEQIVHNLRQNALRNIFYLLKMKTIHQSNTLKFEDLDWVSMTERQLLFMPLFQQMKQMQVQLSEQEFVMAGMKLISYLSQKQKNLLIETVHKHHEQKKQHKMSISSKSQAILKDKSLYQQYDVYTRGLIHKKSVKQQIQRGRQQKVRDQLKDCTFKPVINKQYIQV